MDLHQLNFNHLHYFWMVAREGSVTAASRKLQLAQPSVSAQLRKLEERLGTALFQRTGRNLVLTEAGQALLVDAEAVFAAGQRLVDHLHGQSGKGPRRLAVGVPDVMPKLITYRLLAGVYSGAEQVELHCYEGGFNDLIGRLALGQLDVVLADSPVSSRLHVRAFNHKLGECGLSFFGVPTLAEQYRANFPESLHRAPLLLPTPGAEVRRSLDQWFEQQALTPRIVGEFDDSALLKEFGRAGVGLFAMPTVMEGAIAQHFGVELVGRVSPIRESYFAITTQQRIRHPGVLAITATAKGVFGG
jgi:LysR family transcriptional regulator, transcriptional activator of nhaA